MPQEQKQKKKRVPITALTKQEICIKKRENMKLRDEDLAKEYGLDRSTITKILKQRDKWLAIDPNSNYAKQKTQKSPKFPQIEEALASWLAITSSQGNAVSDGQLQEKALEFAQISGAPDVSLQITPQSAPITGTVLSPPEHSNFSSTVSLFRPGYPEVSPNNRHFENLKSLGRLVDGTKGAEFIDGMVPRDVNMSITVVRDCCFDGSDLVQNVLMDEIFPKQGVMVVSFEEIVNGLRSI
ncbi:5898_t:CDS:2 [Racocetra fulgida]|uniref:5898_t:CDS:1 n=1 Tax=Racocetra fulgida TaxID=60492 RepID=A0A9N8W1E5_9GLOM|nr:5898_t:CDS:2 [Racocetra fulgida]